MATFGASSVLPPEDSLTVAFASATGTAADYAARFATLASRRRLPVGYVGPLDDLSLPTLARCRALVLFISTTGDGDMPPNGSATWRALLRRDLPPTALAGIGGVTMFGLGDSGYPKFAAAARKAWTRMTGQLGAPVVWPRGLGDENSPQGLAGDFSAWLRGAPTAPGGDREGVWAALASLFPPDVQAAVTTLPPLPPAPIPRRYRVWQLPQPHQLGATPALSAFEAAYVSPVLVPLSRCVQEGGEASVLLSADQSVGAEDGGDSGTARHSRAAAAAPAAVFPFLPTPPSSSLASSSSSSPSTATSPSTPGPHPWGAAIVPARVVSNTRATAADWSQDVRYIRLAVPPPPGAGAAADAVQPGDVAVVWAANTSASCITGCEAREEGATKGATATPCPVTALASRLGCRGADLDAPLAIAPTSAAGCPPAQGTAGACHPWDPPPRASDVSDPAAPALLTTLRTLLGHWLSATSGALSRTFFEQAAFCTDPASPTGADEAAKLLELASPDASDLYHAYAVAERRGLPDVLADFIATHPPLSLLLEALPPLHPRAYSLAGATRGLEGGVEVELCVAVATAKTPYGRRHTGLASGWLAALPPGALVPVSFKRGAFNPHGQLQQELTGAPAAPAPIVMIGPGTGVAPMMAVLRAAVSGGQRGAPTLWLMTGFRHRRKDWLYAAETLAAAGAALQEDTFGVASSGEAQAGAPLLAVTDTGNALVVAPAPPQPVLPRLLRYGVAFSRDDAAGRRLYVQGLLERQGGALLSLLAAGARVWIAGSAKGMPADVQGVLQDMIARGVAAAAAEAAAAGEGGLSDAAAAGAAIAAATLTPQERAALAGAPPQQQSLPPLAVTAATRFLTAAARDGRLVIEAWT